MTDQPTPDTTYLGRKPPPQVRQRWYEEALRYVATANACHQGCRTAMIGVLDHARHAGLALREAKRRVTGRQWTKFLQAHFVGSPETARVYMRVARLWDDPRVVQARTQGLSVNSIRGLLSIAQGQSPTPSPDPSPPDRLAWLRQLITERLQELDETELTILEQRWPDVWDATYEALRRTLCEEMGYDWYHDPETIRIRYEMGRINSAQRHRLTQEAQARRQSRRSAARPRTGRP